MADTALHPARTTAPAVHAILAPLAAGLLLAALVTDIIYARSYGSQWVTFSIWLITFGLIVAALAGLGLIVDLVIARRWARADAWRTTAGVCAGVTALVNAFVHSRDGYTAVVPTGLGLSILTAVFLALVGWRGWDLRLARPGVRR